MFSDPYVMSKLDAELASAARVGSHVPQRITRCHCTRERLAPPRPFIALRCAGSCIPEVCCAASLRLRTVQRRRTTVCGTAADGNTMQKPVLEAQIATAENFRPFGQVPARSGIRGRCNVRRECIGCCCGAAHQEMCIRCSSSQQQRMARSSTIRMHSWCWTGVLHHVSIL